MLRGVIAPSITFFTNKGELDESKCKWHMEWMLSKGVKGLFVTGTYGSGYLLSLSERVKIFEIAQNIANHYLDTYVIAHTGCPDLSKSIYLTQMAEEIGIEATSAINPFYFKYSEKELLKFYEGLVNSSGKPFFAYNNPELTGKALSWTFLKELRSIGVAGVKDSAIDMQLASSIFADQKTGQGDFQYVPGTTTGWIGFRRMDAHAMIAGMSNYAPELVVALYNTSYENEEKASEVYRIVMDLSRRLKFGNSIASSHICLKARGYDAGFARLPMTVNYAEMKEEIAAADRAMEEAIARVRQIGL